MQQLEIEELCQNKRQWLPKHISDNKELAREIQRMPAEYDFEIHKTLWFIEKHRAVQIGLQFPEGLLHFSFLVSSLLQKHSSHPIDTVILGDVSYGACCVDDSAAALLHCDLLVHYGHSCLVPVNLSSVRMLYIFVRIETNTDAFLAFIEKTFLPEQPLCLISTIQFVDAVARAKKTLEHRNYTIELPHNRPLSRGEILGCTSPVTLKETAIYYGDGDFHLESFVIANPQTDVYAFDPYTEQSKKASYDIGAMLNERLQDIAELRQAQTIGIVFSMLGRQGNPQVLDKILRTAKKNQLQTIVVAMAEVTPSRLERMNGIDGWVQIVCPRLSIDWRKHFNKPIVTPYEFSVAFGETEWKDIYPMDYYSFSGSGEWTINSPANTMVECPRTKQRQQTHIELKLEN